MQHYAKSISSMIPNNFIKWSWNIWSLIGKPNTLPFSLTKVAIKGSHYNFGIMLAVVQNERFISFYLGTHFMKEFCSAINYFENKKFHMLFLLQKKKKKDLACIFFHNNIYSKHLSAYCVGGILSVLHMDYFIYLSLSNITLVMSCFLFIFGFLGTVMIYQNVQEMVRSQG